MSSRHDWFPAPVVTLSLLIEWDNQRFNEPGRTGRVLASLCQQIGTLWTPETAQQRTPEQSAWLERLERPFELLVAYNPEDVDRDELSAVLACAGLDVRPEVSVKLLPVPGEHYYALKNEAAKHAGGDLLLFLDCDVVPEPGWLEAILCSFLTDTVAWVGSQAYVEPAGVINQSMSLIWIFPPPVPDGPVQPHPSFYANGFAVPRRLFMAHPFPQDARMRGACLMLSHQLRAAGIPVYRNPRARLLHPVPYGLRNFVVRGLVQGHDDLAEARPCRSHFAIWKLALASGLHQLLLAWSRVFKHRRQVSLPPIGIPVAMGISAAYYGFYTLGKLLAHYRPVLFEETLVM